MEEQVSIFNYPGRPFGKEKIRTLTDNEIIAATRYVLLNCEEVQPYIEEYVKGITTSAPQLTILEVNQMIDANFPTWFQEYPDTQPPHEAPTGSSSGAHPFSRPCGKDPADGKTWIYPDKDSFDPVIDVVREITSVIHEKFDRPCYNGATIPPEILNMWFGEWAKSYKWLPEYKKQIKKNWEKKAKDRLRGLMCKVRAEKKRPLWIPENVYEQLLAEWGTDSYKRKQEKAKQNRASAKGGTLHSCGSIPASEHKRRLKKELRKEPTFFELFERTHKRKDSGEFVDQRAADAYDEYNKLKSLRSSQASANGINEISKDEENAIWLEVVGGKNRKGHVFGVGSEALEVGSSSVEMSSATETWLHPQFQAEIERCLAKQAEENQAITDVLKQKVEEQSQIITSYKDKFAEHERLIGELFYQLQVSRAAGTKSKED